MRTLTAYLKTPERDEGKVFEAFLKSKAKASNIHVSYRQRIDVWFRFDTDSDPESLERISREHGFKVDVFDTEHEEKAS